MQGSGPLPVPERGTLFLVVGPSGSGKDTLLRGAGHVLRTDARFVFPQRTITRALGAGSEDHIDATPDEFEAHRAAGAFALHWTAHGYSYGIPKSIEGDLDAGRSVVVNVSRTIIEEARARLAPIRVILLTVSDDVLAHRLASRGREPRAEMEARLSRSRAFRISGNDVVEIANDGSVQEAIMRFVAVLSDPADGQPAGGGDVFETTADRSV